MATGNTNITKFRNMGIIAHIDAGKTTTTEHILFYAGAHKLGAVDSGNTETDFDEEEQERGITIYSACIPFQWKGHTINLIDTPGHVDFTAEVERSLRVLDGCVVVFDAQKGVEAQSETVWRQANKYRVPRMVFINKMDVVGADFSNALSEVHERLDGNPVALTIPIGSGSVKDSEKPLEAIIDLLQMKAIYYNDHDQGKTFKTVDIPEDMVETAQEWREKLFDTLTANDDEDKITSLYLEGEEIPIEKIHEVIRDQTLKLQIHPLLCGSGRENIGIQPLMDAIVWYLPSPLDVPPVVGHDLEKQDKELIRKPDPKEPFAGLVFKIVASPHGELAYLRIYSGTLKANSRMLNPGKNAKEMISKIYYTLADPKKRKDISEAYAGDIVALISLKESITGDTLCDPKHPILLEQIHFADAVVSQSIEPESSADKDKLAATLDLLRKEDPTFSWKADTDTGQTLMHGMGMLHLEIKQHRMERDFNLKIRVGKPRVSYRETLRAPIEVVGECVRQTTGSSLFAKVRVRLEPSPETEGVSVVREIDPEALPPLFVQSAEQGIRGALESGELGYPVIHVKATILSGEMDQELSNETAFQAAGADAVHKAMRENIYLLEPVMRLEVTVPEEFLGSITSDLHARRAEISEIITRGKLAVVKAVVPLAKMFDYGDKVRSLSQGRASSVMEPWAYKTAPDEMLQALVNPDSTYF